MSAKRFRLDDLLGRIVKDRNGATVGRLYDIRSEEQDGALVVVEYHIGTHALAERVGASLARIVGIHRSVEPRKVPWDQLDISDPDNPVYLGNVAENIG